MCFDVPKVVRSPGCDHGHDEESQNSRDIKIDMLEGYVWTPERFQISSGIFQSTGWLPEPSGELMGLNGPWWERGGGGQVGGACPPSPIRIGRGRPPFPSLPLHLPSSPTPTREGGKPTPTGSRTPPLGAPPPLGRPPSPLLYKRRRGHPIDTTIDPLDLLAVCGAPLHHNPPR